LDEIEFYLEDLKSKFAKIRPKDYYLSYSGGRDSHFLYWFIKEYLKDDKIEIISPDGNILTIDESEYLPFSTAKLGNVELVLPEDGFFVMGDNRGVSFDSRRWGYLPKEYIIGRVFLRAFPFQRFELIEAPTY